MDEAIVEREEELHHAREAGDPTALWRALSAAAETVRSSSSEGRCCRTCTLSLCGLSAGEVLQDLYT